MSKIKKEGWRELPIGGLILEPGTAKKNKTGSWRNQRPIRDEKRCIHCLLCWIYCPEGTIIVKDEKVVGVDLEYCKGCGICVEECPPKVKAIKMVSEIK